MKLLVVIVLIFCLSDVRTCDAKIRPIDGGDVELLPCSATFRCSLEEHLVWATDGISCYVFLNPCFLALENCNREREHKKALVVIDKEKCQTLCNAACPKCDKPVCAEYKGQLRDFAGVCWMDYHNCKTGEIFTFYNDGPCET